MGRREVEWEGGCSHVSGVTGSGGDCCLVALCPMQAAHRGADPPSGVRAAPARRGCLPELVHPCGHQWEEVCALGPGGDPRTLCLGWNSWADRSPLHTSASFSVMQRLIRSNQCVTTRCMAYTSGLLRYLSAVRAACVMVKTWEAEVRWWPGVKPDSLLSCVNSGRCPNATEP